MRPDSDFEGITAAARASLAARWARDIERALADDSTPDAERHEIIDRLHEAIAKGDPAALDLAIKTLHNVATHLTSSTKALAELYATAQDLKASVNAHRRVFIARGPHGDC